jgi:FdhD protein
MKALDAPLMPPGVCPATVRRWRDGQPSHDTDLLAREVPVALVFNGISHAVMLASPDDLEDFALGFALSEGLLRAPAEFYGAEAHSVPEGIELHIDVAAACEMRLRERRRTLAGRTGCGLCGTDSLQQLRRPAPPVPSVHVAPAAIARAQRQLRQHQVLQQLTGATHAAAWCDPDGALHCVREDVGRHNALDKLIGALQFAGQAPRWNGDTWADGFVCITSRASYEMVQKAAMLGSGVLAAVSAPTALAVATACAANLALAGFVRGDDLVAYSFAERFGLGMAPNAPPCSGDPTRTRPIDVITGAAHGH